MRESMCVIHVQLAELRTLVSNNIYSTGLVKAVGTCQCIKFVNAGDLEQCITYGMRNRTSRATLPISVEWYLPNVATAHVLYDRSIPNTDGTNR